MFLLEIVTAPNQDLCITILLQLDITFPLQMYKYNRLLLTS